MPPVFSQFETTQIQATVFTPGGQFAVSRLFARIIERFPDLASGEPVILPSTSASNVPRILLHTEDNRIGVQILSEAATFLWVRQPGMPHTDRESFLNIAHSFLSFFLQEAPAKAGRLALVTHRIFPQEDPSNTLADYFCGKTRSRDLLGPLEAFELHAMQRFDLAEDYPVNSWLRCKPGAITLPNDLPTPPLSGIFVEQDINTLSEIADTVVFSEEQMREFWALAATKQDKILQRHFPEA